MSFIWWVLITAVAAVGYILGVLPVTELKSLVEIYSFVICMGIAYVYLFIKHEVVERLRRIERALDLDLDDDEIAGGTHDI